MFAWYITTKYLLKKGIKIYDIALRGNQCTDTNNRLLYYSINNYFLKKKKGKYKSNSSLT